MSIRDFNGDGRFSPISAWGYVGFTLLFLVPVVGQVFLVWFTFSSGNLHRRSFARSFWCLLLALALGAVGVHYGAFQYLEDHLPPRFQALSQWARGAVNSVISVDVRLHFLPPVSGAQGEQPAAAGEAEQPDVSFSPENGTATPASQAAANAGSAGAAFIYAESPSVAPILTPVPSAAPPAGVSPNLFETMTGYEAFVYEYVAFMRFYNPAAGDSAETARYDDFRARYAEMMERLDALEDAPMSPEDEAYFLRVRLRIDSHIIQAALKY